MYSVTKRISMIKQPRGGYINKKELMIMISPLSSRQVKNLK